MQEFKDSLGKCVNYEDIFEVMRVTPKGILKEFVNALDTAREFIELTMRDETLLNTAKGYLVYKN